MGLFINLFHTRPYKQPDYIHKMCCCIEHQRLLMSWLPFAGICVHIST